MDKGQAKPYWQKGIFCIMLLKEPSARNYQPIALGVDPGSKREGYTVATEKSVVINITTDTKDWVKKHVETRRNLRRARRQRNTPYRKCRLNRRINQNSIPPSIKTKWETRLQMIKYLISIIPITIVNVEDIKAKTIEGQDKKNKSFSPLEVGKNWFYAEVEKLGVKLILTKGYDTKTARDARGFSKTKDKLDWIWGAHNVDSHILCELALKKEVRPYLGIWKIQFTEYQRRVLHLQNFKKSKKGSYRRADGSTVSAGMSRGSVVRYKGKLYELGGNTEDRKVWQKSRRKVKKEVKVTINDIYTGDRIKRNAKVSEVKMIYTSNRRVQFLPRLKSWVPLHN